MKLETPLISIIVPVYEIEKYICDCLESIKTQSYPNFECLIIDDCGHDNSITLAYQLIKKWNNDNRFIIIRRNKNGGLSAARNTGIDYSSGDYIYFLDGDDKIMPQALESLVFSVCKYPGVQMVQGNVVYENNKEVWQFKPSDFPEYSENQEWIRAQMLQWKIAISSWNKLYRSDYIKANRLRFQEGIIHEDVKWCWDNQKVLRSIAFNNYQGYWYRTGNQNSIMHDVDKTNSSVAFLRIFQRIAGDINDMAELEFVKSYILPYKVSLHRWSLSKNRKKIRAVLKEIMKNSKPVTLSGRCLWLYLLSYIFPFNIYRNLQQ